MVSIIDEEWRVVPGTDGKYEVSNLGQVRCKSSGRILRYVTKDSGYRPSVNMRINAGLTTCKQVSHLVALAFVPNPNKFSFVENIDGDYFNCRADNLRWAKKMPTALRKSSRDSMHAVRPMYHSDVTFEVGECYIVFNAITWAAIKVTDATKLKFVHYLEGNTIVGEEDGHSDKLPICSDDKVFSIPEKVFVQLCALHDARNNAPAFVRAIARILGGIIIEKENY